MKFSKLALATLLALFLISGCNRADKIVIDGEYPGITGKYIYITRIDVDIPVLIDSVRIDKKGAFRTTFQAEIPEFYNIGFNNTNFVTVIAYPGDKIHLKFNGNKLQEDYSVEGSQESEDLRLLDLKLSQTLASLDSLGMIFDAMPDEADNLERRNEVEAAYSVLVKEQRMHNIGFIIENLKSFASIKALFQRLNENAYVLYKPTDAQYLKLVSDTLNSYYPNSKQAISLAQNLEKELAALNLSRISMIASEMEQVDLDIELMDISGERVKLSSLKGKSYVLLSFWSAQSKDCISNNLQMKNFYQRYHRKGFEIYQVNLDTDENLWKQTVGFDEIPWISVREDDPENALSVVQYNVTKLPANYMLDMEGVVIGKNLFGRSLQIKLSQLFD